MRVMPLSGFVFTSGVNGVFSNSYWPVRITSWKPFWLGAHRSPLSLQRAFLSFLGDPVRRPHKVCKDFPQKITNNFR